jgi:hypothetical protein
MEEVKGSDGTSGELLTGPSHQDQDLPFSQDSGGFSSDGEAVDPDMKEAKELSLKEVNNPHPLIELSDSSQEMPHEEGKAITGKTRLTKMKAAVKSGVSAANPPGPARTGSPTGSPKKRLFVTTKGSFHWYSNWDCRGRYSLVFKFRDIH